MCPKTRQVDQPFFPFAHPIPASPFLTIPIPDPPSSLSLRLAFVKCLRTHMRARAVHPMKSSLHGPHSTAPATKSALQGPQSQVTAPCLEICTSRTQRFTSRRPAKAIRTKSTSANNIKMPTSENKPHVQKVTTHRVCHENQDHHHAQSTAPATKSLHRRKATPISCACHEKFNIDHQSTRFPLRLPGKVVTKSKKCAQHNNESTTLRACAVEMHFEDLEVNECTVNSSELAANADEHPRSTTRP